MKIKLENRQLLEEINSVAKEKGLDSYILRSLCQTHAIEKIGVNFRDFKELFRIGAILNEYADNLGDPFIDQDTETSYSATFLGIEYYRPLTEEEKVILRKI